VLAMKEMSKTCSVYKFQVHILENPWWKQIEKFPENVLTNSCGEEHPGIICYCCHHQVSGFRYKCVVCPHYDMCGVCESKGLHPAHDMVRIPSPRTYPPHFFLRLHRLYERCIHSSPTMTKQGCGQLSSPNEQIARDLLEEDNSDISDLELEVSLVPESTAGPCSAMSARKRYSSDPGSCSGPAEKVFPLENSNSILLKEQLPSFEELTKSMQDLAEKDIDDFVENTKIETKVCFKSEKEKLEKLAICSPDDMKSKQNPNTTEKNMVGSDSKNAWKDKEERKMEEAKSESKENNNEKDVIDTSETFRNIQQEIESLLAPLTPLPDLDPVPKAVKNGDNKETFVLMKNKSQSFGTEKSRANSFEIVENNVKEVSKSNSMDDWSLLGDKHSNDIRNEADEEAKNEEIRDESLETGNESSETETEDQNESEDDCNGNIPAKDSNCENFMQLQSKDKEQKGQEIDADRQNQEADVPAVALTSSTPSDTDMDFSGGISRIVGGSSLLRYHQWQQKQSSTDEGKEQNGHQGHISDPEPRRHYNPRVADALDKMVGMGFTDDDGWLTQLLVMKHGDISQVLDILTPVKK